MAQRTLAQVRQAVSAACRDLQTTTVVSISGQTLRCPELAHLATGELNDSEMHVYSGTGIGQSRLIKTHTQDTTNNYGTLLPYTSWTTAPDTTSLVEIHLRQWGLTATVLNDAITQAHHAADDIYLVDVVDETLVCQAGRHAYPLPSSFRWLSGVARDFPADVGVPGSVYDSGALNWGSQFYDQDRGLQSTSAQTKLSQSFTITSGGLPQGFWCGGVALYLRTVGTPTSTDTLTVRLETTSSSLPSGTLIASAATATRLVSAVLATYALVQFKFSAPVFLATDVVAQIVLSTSGSTDSSNYVAWGEDTSTSYSRGYAGRYSGSAWSTISSSALIFSAQTSQINERFVDVHRDSANGPEWRVIREGASTTNLLWLANPSEGARLRLSGQGPATIPSASTSSVGVPEEFLLPKAISIALATMGGGPESDADARDRWSQWHEQRAERAIPRVRTQIRPNSASCSP